MHLFITILLIIHIAAGFTALLLGLVGIISRKGAKTHRLSGTVYFWAMMIVGFTAVIMASIKGLTFLLAIGIFSFYLAFGGYRAVLRKGKAYQWPDFMVMAIAAVAVVYMLATLDIVLMIFGGILVLNLWGDIKLNVINKDKKTRAKAWVFVHIGKMMGAYIATVTAFIVTNVHTGYPLVNWLSPTLVGSILISYFIRKQKKKAVPGQCKAAVTGQAVI